METHAIPLRRDVPAEHRWDLSSLFHSRAAWEAALSRLPALSAAAAAYKGSLASSKEALFAALAADAAFGEAAEAAACYASLLAAADTSDTEAQEMLSRVMMTCTRCAAEQSFLTPEIQAIPESALRAWLSAPDAAPWRTALEKLLRMKPYVLSAAEEKILALQAECARSGSKTFSLLTNADFDFGSLEADGRSMPLTQSTWSVFMERPERSVRAEAYRKFYAVYESHKNALAALYEGSVNQDIFEARSRGYESARAMALFPDNVPASVYDNLIAAVRKRLPALHRYYALRKRALALPELRHYDVYVPIAPAVKTRIPYEEAAETVSAALAPLGAEYTETLRRGLLSGWVDRYENKGKRSGAFSSGAYRSYPYILLNYKEDVLRDVFTVAHEGGHSMHSWYSSRANPFQYHAYTIFEAEVASTFNEELLFRYLLRRAEDAGMKTYLLSIRASDIVGTLFRQTMFAEFEDRAHRMAEAGEPLTVDALRSVYGALLRDYFGPEMVFEEASNLEALRIPHFYSAFYVYKYATGISAALALAGRVLSGGEAEREAYFAFLKSGGSRYPIESLRAAGVDMETAEPVERALDRFEGIVGELEGLL